MTKNYDHHIAKHIKSVYRKRLLSPIIYLVILLILWLVLPLQHLLFPQKITSVSDLSKYQRQRDSYVQTTLTDLYFTGYTNTLLGQKTGYYYYTMWEDKCVIVLLSPKTCEEGLPMIESAHIRGRILRGNKAFHTLLDSLAEDLNWTTQGISSKLSPYLISEPAFMSVPSTVLMIVYFLTGLYALIRLIADTTYIFFPVLAPACRQLSRFGKPSVLLAQAEEELATLPQLATEDMFITEHYFIELANYGIAIVPIQEMIWIYKHSTLHKFLWYHFSISYTLHITANKYLYIQCPKNMKSDIDGIMDYLEEANHNILVGFNEENRLKVQEMQNRVFQFDKMIAFLKRRI